MSFTADLVSDLCLREMRARGRAAVRRRLEVLVNAGIIGVAGADKVYHDAFGGRLKAVKDYEAKAKAGL